MNTALFLVGSCLLLAVFPVALVLPRARIFRLQPALWLILLGNLLLTWFSLDIFIHDKILDIDLYQLLPGLEISFHIDRLASFFISIIVVVSICTAIYSTSYVHHITGRIRQRLSIALMSLFVLSMVGVVAASNTFTLLFFWETMSFSSFLLVMTEYEQPQTLKSGLFYFIMTQFGTVFLLFAFVLSYTITGSFDIAPLSGASSFEQSLVFVMLFIGFGTKAGVIPFHKWLPYAHSASPSNISALMSGVMIKVAIYGMVRYLLFVLDPEPWWGIMILVFGLVSALLGVIYALKEPDLKKMLAYCSIENIGVILIGLGLNLIFTNQGLDELAFLSLAGALFHTLNHALFKSLLFMIAGSVISVTGTRDLTQMGGLIKLMPKTGLLFLIGAAAISALPPLNGFVSELMIFQSFLQSFDIRSDFIHILMLIGLSLFALTSALAAATFVKAFGMIFLALPRSEKARGAHEVAGPMLVGPLILAILCVLFGVFSYQISRYLDFPIEIPNMMLISIIMIFNMVIIFGLLRLFANRTSRTAETWGCGITWQHSTMEYTPSGFSYPLVRVFTPIYRTRESIRKTFADRRDAIVAGGKAQLRTFHFFEESLYMPIAHAVERISRRISNLHNVDLDIYILASFLTVIILILVMGWVL